MVWYVTQSLPTILATFVLGLIVGWLWWGRVWRRVPFGESHALRTLSDRYRAVIAERDAEIDRLGQLGPSREPPVTSPGDGGHPDPAALGQDGDPPRSPGTTARDPDGTGPDGGGTEGGPPASGTGAAGTGTAIVEPIEPIEPDDLQRIEGIGPRIATALADAGLDSYRAIAVADSEQLGEALRAAGLNFAPSLVTWPLQARLLASGDEHGLAMLQAKLTAGRARPTAPAPSGTTEPRRTEATAEAAAPTARAAEGGDGAPGGRGDLGPGLAGAETTETETTETETTGPETTGPETPGAETPGAEQEEDELERVEGIGPRIATALHKAGIRTYHQLASADRATLQAALAASGLRFTPSLPTWSRQAALLADGDEEGFRELTRTLIPERESGRGS